MVSRLMKERTSLPELYKVLRLRSAFFLCLGISGVLLGLGQRAIPAGFGIGYVLFVLNGFFLIETGRSLLAGCAPRRVRLVVAITSSGRILLLGLMLALTGSFLGREVLIGVCGGLLTTQINLHFPIRRTGVAT